MKLKMQDLVAKAVAEAREAKAKGAVINNADTKGADAKKTADLETRWFKAFASRNERDLAEVEKEIVAERKAADLTGQDTVTAAEGGWLVPTTVESTIVKKLNATSEIRKFATVINNVVGKIKLGAEDALVQAYWVAEGDLATDSTATWANVELQPQKAVGFGKFTDEVLTQTVSNPDIRKLVVDGFANAIMRLEDAAFTNGDGNGKPAGYRTMTLPAGHTITGVAGAMAANVNSLYRAVPKAYRDNGNFMLNDVTVGYFDEVKDTTGRPLFNTMDADVDKIKGRPVGYDSNLPDGEAWFGDFSKYVITDGAGIRVDYGTEGDDFKRSKISVRVIHYTDGATVLPEAFAKATGLDPTV